MHKLYNNDGKLRLIQGITREEALEREEAIHDGDEQAIISTTASDEDLIRIISDSSQNSLSFYPRRLFLEEAIKRGLNIQEIVSNLPLLTKDVLHIPKGVELWSEGKEYKIF
jgi:hypothetical protein